MEELVSIIVPIFNVESYIKQCVESILAQTHIELELLLIDDGSSDKSKEICEEYQVLDSRVKIFTQKHQGVSVARNKGLEEATGKYIMFVDADDFVSPTIVQDLLAPLKENKRLIMSAGRGKVVYTQEYEFPNEQEDADEQIASIEMLKRQFLGAPYAQGACVKIFRRDKISTLRFEEGISYSEDSYFTYKYCLHNEGDIYILQKRLYAYYMRANSATHKLFKKEKLSVLYLARKKYEDCQTIIELKEAACFGVVNSILFIIKDIIRSNCYRKELSFIKKLRKEILGISLSDLSIINKKKQVEITFLKMGLTPYYLFVRIADLLRIRNKI
jgi:glycosyltransferase involved in cell wall biosynthesis